MKYTVVSGTLAFGTGETNRIIVVPTLNNGFAEGVKNFRIVLSNYDQIYPSSRKPRLSACRPCDSASYFKKTRNPLQYAPVARGRVLLVANPLVYPWDKFNDLTPAN